MAGGVGCVCMGPLSVTVGVHVTPLRTVSERTLGVGHSRVSRFQFESNCLEFVLTECVNVNPHSLPECGFDPHLLKKV